MTKRYRIPPDVLRLTCIRRSDRIPRNRGRFDLGVTKAQYGIRRLCSDWKGRVTVRINPNSLIAWQKVLSTSRWWILIFFVCILLGISPATDCGLPTFRNPLSLPFSRAGCKVWSILHTLHHFHLQGLDVKYEVRFILYIQPLKMELIEGSETSANHNRTPGKYPKEYIQISLSAETSRQNRIRKWATFTAKGSRLKKQNQIIYTSCWIVASSAITRI